MNHLRMQGQAVLCNRCAPKPTVAQAMRHAKSAILFVIGGGMQLSPALTTGWGCLSRNVRPGFLFAADPRQEI